MITLVILNTDHSLLSVDLRFTFCTHL